MVSFIAFVLVCFYVWVKSIVIKLFYADDNTDV